ncbi:hypothetical protein [Herbiconiux liangxiaofengii]|uniref:hypothetical protein n=1 Tax=Herbiconiux liangxiaofengii TaxID=3342795 RepID=UPI0035B94EDE
MTTHPGTPGEPGEQPGRTDAAPVPASSPATAGVPTEAPAPSPSGRRRPRPWLVALLVALLALLLAAGFYAWTVLADNRSVEARTDYATALEAHDDASAALKARLRSAHSTLVRTRSVVSTAEFAADPLPESEPLQSRTTELGDLETEAESQNTDDDWAAPASADGWRPPWDVTAEADSIARIADDITASTAALTDLTDRTATADDALGDASDAYFTAVAAEARTTIANNTLATKRSTVALTRLVEQADDLTQPAAHTGPLLVELVAAERDVEASQQTIAAQLADPAWAVRNEIEAYARSISHGITLDFDWSPEVSGKGEGWYSGTAQTFDSDGGWAIISLNYPVEDDWYSDPNPRALVTHEVGHTQIYRPNCQPLFSGPVFANDQEAWATAWAIAQGFDLPGSGIEAYGRPTDEQIATAAECD